MGAKQGQKAVAKVVDLGSESKNPVAEIINVLGYPGLHETEMHAILAEFELPYSFTEESRLTPKKFLEKLQETILKFAGTSAKYRLLRLSGRCKRL